MEAINAYSAKLNTDLRTSTPGISALTHIAETQVEAGKIKVNVGAKITGPGGGGNVILFYVPVRGLEKNLETRIKRHFHFIKTLSLHYEGAWSKDSFSEAFVKLDFLEKEPHKFLLECDMLESTKNHEKLKPFRIICQTFVKRGVSYLPTGPGNDSACFSAGDSANLIGFYFLLKNKCENEGIYLRAAINKGETDFSKFKDYLQISGKRNEKDPILPTLAQQLKLFKKNIAGICMPKELHSPAYGSSIKKMKDDQYVIVGKIISS